MMNVTSQLAIRVRYIPDFEFSWSDKTPQRSRQSITIEDISPSQSDTQVLKQHAVQVFLVKMFPSLHDLEQFIPPVEPIHLPVVQKSEVVPMKLLLKEEKYKTETIDILTQLYSDAALSGDHRVSINTIRHPYFPIICINIMDLTHPSLCMHTCTCTCTCNQSIMIFCR